MIEIILWANLPMSTIFKVMSNRKWTCCRFKNALHDTVLHTDALCQISGSWPVWFPRKMWQKLSCQWEQICLCPQYSSRVKQEVDMLQIQKCVTRYSSPYRCSVPNIRKLEGGSRGKCDRNFLWRWWRKTMDSDPYLSPPLKPAGDTKTDILMKYVTPYHSIIF